MRKNIISDNGGQLAAAFLPFFMVIMGVMVLWAAFSTYTDGKNMLKKGKLTTAVVGKNLDPVPMAGGNNYSIMVDGIESRIVLDKKEKEGSTISVYYIPGRMETLKQAKAGKSLAENVKDNSYWVWILGVMGVLMISYGISFIGAGERFLKLAEKWGYLKRNDEE